MTMSFFRASAHVPPGLAIALCGDVIVFFGPMGALADKMQSEGLPTGTIIHCSMKDYLRISKGAQKAAPDAPSIEAQNREFSGQHTHPKTGKTIAVFKMDLAGDHWMWCASGKLVTDQTRYPTAEAAYLAAIGE
jgi:hypothetical protein